MDFTAVMWFVIIVLVIRFILSETEDKPDEKKKALWRTLAATNHLDFVFTGSQQKGLQIRGSYRGYHLELFIDQISYGKSTEIGTCLELTDSQFKHNSSVIRNRGIDELIIGIHGEELTVKEAVNRLAPIRSDKDLPGQITLLGYGGIAYQQPGIIEDTKFLQSLFDRLSDVLDYYQTIVDVGGEIAPFLASLVALKDTREPTLIELLEGIAQKTTGRLGHYVSQLLCPHCLVSFSSHQVKLSWWRSTTYYGCRVCSQSREFFRRPVNLIAVLDNIWNGECSHQDGLLRVNWLARQSLFDFDWVEIIQASDEDVERFAVQAGNDTDPFRKARYQRMTCWVGPECRLSENTSRILERMFGQVWYLKGVTK